LAITAWINVTTDRPDDWDVAGTLLANYAAMDQPSQSRSPVAKHYGRVMPCSKQKKTNGWQWCPASWPAK
jgi:hypothetical protein